MSIAFPDDVLTAYARIRKDIRRTPLELRGELGRATGARVLIKWERRPDHRVLQAARGASTSSGRFRPRSRVRRRRLRVNRKSRSSHRPCRPARRDRADAVSAADRRAGQTGEDRGPRGRYPDLRRRLRRNRGPCPGNSPRGQGRSSFPRITIPTSSPGRAPSASRSWRTRRTSTTSSLPSGGGAHRRDRRLSQGLEHRREDRRRGAGNVGVHEGLGRGRAAGRLPRATHRRRRRGRRDRARRDHLSPVPGPRRRLPHGLRSRASSGRWRTIRASYGRRIEGAAALPVAGLRSASRSASEAARSSVSRAGAISIRRGSITCGRSLIDAPFRMGGLTNRKT